MSKDSGCILGQSSFAQTGLGNRERFGTRMLNDESLSWAILSDAVALCTALGSFAKKVQKWFEDHSYSIRPGSYLLRAFYRCDVP